MDKSFSANSAQPLLLHCSRSRCVLNLTSTYQQIRKASQ